MTAARISTRRFRSRFCASPGCSVRLLPSEPTHCPRCVTGSRELVTLADALERRASKGITP